MQHIAGAAMDFASGDIVRGVVNTHFANRWGAWATRFHARGTA